MSCARLRTPFVSLSSDNWLSSGAAGQVFAVSRHVVFKCPTLFDNPTPRLVEEMEESIKKIENEKTMYRILMEHRHPNIVYGILCVSEGIFMHRLETTVQFRLDQFTTMPVGLDLQERWIRQLTSAVVWLERLGYVHGDLRPANALLDAMEDIKLGDFDATVKKGERLLVASETWFCKLDEDYEPPLAGPVSEQFALGSFIYTIRFGNKPFHELDEPTRVWKVIKNEFPATLADEVFGDIIHQCWCGVYCSIGDLEKAVLSRLSKLSGELVEPSNGETAGAIDQGLPPMLLDECKEFLIKEDLRMKESHMLSMYKNA